MDQYKPDWEIRGTNWFGATKFYWAFTKGATNKMIKEINKYNKLIKICDRYLVRWATVGGYISDELASDNEDDKKLKAAE